MIAIFPETLACAAKGDMEELAVHVRQYFGANEKHAPNPDIQLIVERVGLTVESLPMEAMGALVAKDERGVFTTAVLYSPMVEKQTRRFLLAHMLGHYLLDIQPLIARGDVQRMGFREQNCPLRRYIQGDSIEMSPSFDLAKEMRADLFAGALLMPVGMVKRAMETLQDREKVARFFNVSVACLHRRLVDLGLHVESPAHFLDAEASLAGKRGPLYPGTETLDSSDGSNGARASLEAPTEPTTPRAFAASTYGHTAITTSHDTEPQRAKERSPGPRASKGASSRRSGMQRLREIARQLDKGLPPESES